MTDGESQKQKIDKERQACCLRSPLNKEATEPHFTGTASHGGAKLKDPKSILDAAKYAYFVLGSFMSSFYPKTMLAFEIEERSCVNASKLSFIQIYLLYANKHFSCMYVCASRSKEGVKSIGP
jgi:hypothetical protein